MADRFQDLRFMRRAYELALKGKGLTSPNPVVGAVVVKNGRIVGEGWHHRCGGPHAEIYALRAAGRKARGATLYVTLEPCFHFGRTPPCVEAVLRSGIPEVVVGMKDPNPLTNGKSLAKLRRAGLRVRVGFLQKELSAANAPFIKYVRTQMPLVTAKVAQTLDGKVATRAGQSKWITGPATRAFARRLRNDFDGIIVGINTVLQDDPSLSAARPGKRIKKIVLDSSLRITSRAGIFKGNPPGDCIIMTTSAASPRKVDQLRHLGAGVIVLPAKQGQVELRAVLRELAGQGLTSVLIEGGATVVGQALKENLVDKMHIYIAPKILGDQEALSAVNGLAVCDVNQALRLDNLKVQRIADDIFIEGDVCLSSGTK